MMRVQKQKSKFKVRLLLVVVVFVGVWFLMRPKSDHAVQAESPPPPIAEEFKPAFVVTPTWPDNVKAAAIGAEGFGVLARTGDIHKRPIASIAKVITSLAILEKYPLQLGDEGPQIPITERDEQIYRDYIARNGTVVLVKAGTSISLHQALQAMLMPSANNVADTTATWVFGSLQNYSHYANAMVKRLGLKDTVIGPDASGLTPSTQSTASDLVKIGELALKNPIIADIVSTKFAYVPVAGSIQNYNALVMDHGFSGIKPGDSIEAGNTLLFSIKQTVKGKDVNVVGAILGSDGYKQSNNGAMTMVESIKKDLQ
ncbi:MAG TPA: D-alanyl-D-alanine carboxypeptidase [Patescibacteria group bacterium]|nr:D-alanyl-D-alanine carboxypeptidase [Patescibacteria group bacterium]